MHRLLIAFLALTLGPKFWADASDTTGLGLGLENWIGEQSLLIHASSCDGNYLAVNPGQDLINEVTSRGMSISGPVRSPFWSTSIAFAGIKRDCGALVPWVPLSPISTGDGLDWPGRHGLAVQYQHGAAGMRQNFIIDQAPAGTGRLRVVLLYEGDLHAELLSENGIQFLDEYGTERFRYEGLLVWDACGKVLPAFMDTDEGSGSLVIQVDDSGAHYPITVDPIATTANTELVSAMVGSDFGWSARSAGDLNGDGYSDVVVGAPKFAMGELDEGAAFVYYGGPSGIGTVPSVTLQSNLPGAQMGYSVGHAGDLNGDGFSDLAVGALYWENNAATPDEGGVFIYYGSATGISTTAGIVLQSDQANTYMGFWVQGGGDLNADGYSDLLVGSNIANYGNINEGCVWVFRGTATGVTNAPAHRLERNQNAAQFGAAVAGAGDINGDGFDDVVVGAHRFDLSCPVLGCDNGAIFIYYGTGNATRPLGPATNPIPTQTFNTAGISLQTGWAVAGAGDVNGDGYSDVIIGDWRDNIGGQLLEGVAYVFHGSAGGLITTPATTIQNNQAGAWLGRSVSSAGDMNGDGYADVIIGASQFDLSGTDVGAVYIHLGGPGGISPTYFLRLTGTLSGTLLGESVAVAGDVNGDGFSDIIAGGYGRQLARIYHGGTYTLFPIAPAVAAFTPTTVFSGYSGGRAGSSVANAGDVNGDGYSDVLVGAPEADNGQASEGLAFLYYGSSTGLAAFPDLRLEQDIANARFGASVATAGDVNGDGYADVVIGAPESGGTGRAYVFHGSAGGLSPAPALTLAGSVASRFGHAVSTAGDINSDGLSDVLIGAPSAALVFVHLGTVTGTDPVPHATLPGPHAGSNFGWAVATAGDVNGDGYSDIVCGAPNYANGQANEGGAFVYHGSEDGLIVTVARTLEVNVPNALMGFSVAGAGDVNGTGYFDVVVGAPDFTNVQAQEGAVFFYRGSASGLIVTTPVPRTESNIAGARYGYSVAEAGDVNGDGYADISVGAPYNTTGQLEEGRTYVLQGRPSPLNPATASSQFHESNVIGRRYGWSVAGGGDVDGDGYSDIISGSPNALSTFADEGAFTVLRGNWSPSISRPTRLYMTDLASPLATNGLDPLDVYFGVGHVARSHMQRKDGRLQWEVVFEGQPYSGGPASVTNSLLYTAQSAGWTDLGLAGTEIKELVYKEPFRRRYKWRVRVEYELSRSIDGQRFSRWFYGFASAHGDIGVLPVELVEFSGTVRNEGNQLDWSTASENGTDNFQIERSMDMSTFSPIGTMPAAGNSWSMLDYAWLDRDAPNGIAYYRLLMTDLDGSYSYSEIVALNRGTNLHVRPNPVHELLTWQIDDRLAHRARIIDGLGRLVADVPGQLGYIQGAPLRDLTPGSYTLVLLDEQGSVLARTRFLKD